MNRKRHRRRVSDGYLLEDRRSSGGHRVLPAGKSARVFVFSLASAVLFLLIRTVAIVPAFGFGAMSDAYFLGLQLPALLIRTLCGAALALSVALLLSTALDRKKGAPFWFGLSSYVSVLFITVVAFVGLLELLLPPVMRLIYSGRSEETILNAITLSRLLSLQAILLFPSAVFAGVLCGTKLFHRAVTSVMLYEGAAFAFFIFRGRKTPDSLNRTALGFVAAAGMVFLVLLFLSRRVRYYRPAIERRDPAYRQLVRLSVPAMVSAGIIELNAVIRTAFAKGSAGDATLLAHARLVRALPVILFGVTCAGVMLPELKRAFDEKRFDDVRKYIARTWRRALYLAAPFAIISAVMPEDTAEVLFQWGKCMPREALLRTARLIRLFSPSVLLMVTVTVFCFAFFARRLTKPILMTALIALVLNTALCALFARPSKFGIFGLPLAQTAAALAALTVILILFGKSLPSGRRRRMLPFLARLALCGLAAAVFLAGVNTLPVSSGHKALQILTYVLKTALTLFVYYLAGIVLRFRETLDVQKALRRALGFGSAPPREPVRNPDFLIRR